MLNPTIKLVQNLAGIAIMAPAKNKLFLTNEEFEANRGYLMCVIIAKNELEKSIKEQNNEKS